MVSGLTSRSVHVALLRVRCVELHFVRLPPKLALTDSKHSRISRVDGRIPSRIIVFANRKSRDQAYATRV